MKFKEFSAIIVVVFIVIAATPMIASAIWTDDDNIETGYRTFQINGAGEMVVRFVSSAGDYVNFYKTDDGFVVDEARFKNKYIKKGMSDAGDFLIVSDDAVNILYPLKMFGHIEIIPRPASGYVLYRFADVSCGCNTYLENKDGVYILSMDDVISIVADYRDDAQNAGVSNGNGSRLPEISMSLNGVNIPTDVPIYIDNGRTMVPVRFVSEALGARVDWVVETRKVLIRRVDGTVMELTIGKTDMMIKKDKNKPIIVKMDVSAVINNGRTYVPVRYIAEAMGLNVDWNGKTNTVVLTG